MINPDEGKKKRPPTALQVAHWITFKEEQRLEWQKDYLKRLCEADQEITHTYEQIQDFTTMLRERQGEQLDSWLKLVVRHEVVSQIVQHSSSAMREPAVPSAVPYGDNKPPDNVPTVAGLALIP